MLTADPTVILRSRDRDQLPSPRKSHGGERAHPSCIPLGTTACTPWTLLPSLMTAKERFFCLRQERTQPLMVTVESESGAAGAVAARWAAMLSLRADWAL